MNARNLTGVPPSIHNHLYTLRNPEEVPLSDILDTLGSHSSDVWHREGVVSNVELAPLFYFAYCRNNFLR